MLTHDSPTDSCESHYGDPASLNTLLTYFFNLSQCHYFLEQNSKIFNKISQKKYINCAHYMVQCDHKICSI